jgi:hypothetical protein
MKAKKASSKPPPAPEPADTTPAVVAPKFISLENFPRDARKVKFTEPASLEALHRLGFTFPDFNYRSKNDFRRAHLDESVAEMLYNKAEARRQQLIQQALEMRETVLKEQEEEKEAEQRKSDTRLIRVTRVALESEQKKVDAMREERVAALKRLVIQQLREIFVRQFHAEVAEESENRAVAILKQKADALERIQTRRLSSVAPIEGPYVTEPPDVRLAQLQDKRQKEVEERKAKAKAAEDRRQAALQRAMKALEDTTEHRIRLLAEKEEKRRQWEAEDLSVRRLQISRKWRSKGEKRSLRELHRKSNTASGV